MLFFISLMPFILLLLYDFKKSLHMAQQNLYNDDKRFLKWTINDLKSFKVPFKCQLVVIITFIIILLLRLESNLLIGIYFALVNLIIFSFELLLNLPFSILLIGIKFT